MADVVITTGLLRCVIEAILRDKTEIASVAGSINGMSPGVSHQHVQPMGIAVRQGSLNAVVAGRGLVAEEIKKLM